MSRGETQSNLFYSCFQNLFSVSFSQEELTFPAKMRVFPVNQISRIPGTHIIAVGNECSDRPDHFVEPLMRRLPIAQFTGDERDFPTIQILAQISSKALQINTIFLGISEVRFSLMPKNTSQRPVLHSLLSPAYRFRIELQRIVSNTAFIFDGRRVFHPGPNIRSSERIHHLQYLSARLFCHSFPEHCPG